MCFHGPCGRGCYIYPMRSCCRGGSLGRCVLSALTCVTGLSPDAAAAGPRARARSSVSLLVPFCVICSGRWVQRCAWTGRYPQRSV
ncbi:hypothetical protein NDU88_009419 [Pleurodeles waltl]|uniref:Uncharacterized protein n=1 Tax=Pleurodeles waltl TaxID=8319 RepID=A0AAV7RYF4_PLEWA|nr:hypothetical protein NDU88_009419 [Pleurodeles waltl]